MTSEQWNSKFGSNYQITLTNEERKYLALSPLEPHWDLQTYFSHTHVSYTRVTVFFDRDTIVKVINENKRLLQDGTIRCERYLEYDTNLPTDQRKLLLPMTARGKPKKLTPSNLEAAPIFGCSFYIGFEAGKDTKIFLNNTRACKEFFLGESDAIRTIQSDGDFHQFMNFYISTCREDYFEKLETFRTAKKMTIRYKAGDIFRMDLDRTRYCYGLITGKVNTFRSMPELPREHSLRTLAMVPIMVRFYQVITEDPNLKAEDLRHIPLGRMSIVADNDIIWGTHCIVDHKVLAPEDLEFHFICFKILSRDFFMQEGSAPSNPYTLYIEWGFAQAELSYSVLSDDLKARLEDYCSPHQGVSIGIRPERAVPDEKQRQYLPYKNNLLNPENREFRNEVLACLGLPADCGFDQFAETFGGLPLREILSAISKKL